LAEKEKDEKNQELKTKRRDYRGFDEGEFDGGDVRKSVLAKYDEDIEGVTRTVRRQIFSFPASSFLIILLLGIPSRSRPVANEANEELSLR
jgi:hypothetical protein